MDTLQKPGAAAPGEELEHIPGSFPADDMASGRYGADTQSAPAHNKLHKSNDPRGWAQDDDVPRSIPGANTAINAPESDFVPEPQNRESKFEALSANQEPEYVPMSQNRETRAGLAPDEHQAAAVDNGSSANPYWGDIRTGAGVYNTVIGHGSPENSQMRGMKDEGVKTGNTADSPTAAEPVGGADSLSHQREFPLTTSTAAGNDAEKDERSKHKGELAAAGAAAGGGLAPYELDKKHQDDKAQQAQEKDTKAAGQAPTEQKGGILAGIFRRGSKDDKQPEDDKIDTIQPSQEPKKNTRQRDVDDATAAATAAYMAHEVKDDKQRKEDAKKEKEAEQPKEKKEGMLHALFHRSSKDDERPAKEKKAEAKHKHRDEGGADVVAPVDTSRDSNVNPQKNVSPNASRANPEDRELYDSSSPAKDHDFKRDLEFAGVGGAAGYEASKLAQKEQHKSDVARPAQDKTPVDSATKTTGVSENPAMSRPSGTSADTGKPDNTPYPAQNQAAPSRSDHGGAKAVTTGAAAAGAGAATYDVSKKEDTPVRDQGAQPGLATSLATAAPPSSNRQSSLKEGGQYNVLSSGTPSGINIGGNDTIDSSTASPKNEHRDAEAAALAGAGTAGAGAAMYAARNNDKKSDPEPDRAQHPAQGAIIQDKAKASEDKTKPAEDKTVAQPTTQRDGPPKEADAAAAAPAQTGSRVVHNCTKCGEPNDITSYFQH